MNELEKKIIFNIDSMRDGCNRKIIEETVRSDLTNKIIDEFLFKNYLFETNGLLLINYEKIEINPWVDVKIK